MSLEFYGIYCGMVIVASIFFAHALGYLFCRRLKGGPYNIFRYMPGLSSLEYSGKSGAEWEKITYKIRKKVIHSIRKNPTNVEAGELSAVLGENADIVSGILEEFAAKIPSEVKVTSKGRMIYDFEGNALNRLDEKVRAPLKRFLFTVIVFIANIGAVWPFILIAGIGTLVMTQIFSVVDKEGYWMGSFVLVAAAVGFAVILLVVRLFGKIFYAFLYPLIGGPKVLKNATEFFKFKQDEEYMENFRARSRGEKIETVEMKSVKKGGGKKSKRESWSGNIFDNIGDLGSGGVFVIILIAFVAIVGFIFFAIGIWIKNLILAVWNKNGFNPDIAPSEWTHSAVKEEKFMEKLFPGNDLVLRFLRGVKIFLSRERPSDRFMSERILRAAESKSGVISALDIALLEEMGIKEATDTGARLVSRIGGDIATSDNGDLIFVFPLQILKSMKHNEEAEYSFDKEEICNLDAKGVIDTLQKGAPVNIPGVSSTNYKSLYQLVSGSCLLTLAGIALLMVDNQVGMAEKAFIYFIPLVPFGVFVLSGIFGYAVKTSVNNGFYRDIVRSAIREIKVRIGKGEPSFNVTQWIPNNYASLHGIYKSFTLADMQKTVENTCLAIGLDLDMNAMSMPQNRDSVVYSLANIYKSQESVNLARQSDEISNFKKLEKEEIVFNSSREVKS